ncbi:MAG: hypothetical protein QXJ74_01215 [Nitrososphaera sp.]|uniref:hypothetical protein n=1 Tax=Nitrososphaera sp. TaxID=1971748 RepID=UPI0031804ECA
MQTGTRPAQQTASKPLLFGLVAAVVVGIIAPLTLPHVTHPSMVYHIILHIAAVAIAAFLSIVSLTAYSRAGGARTLFMTMGFIALGVAELFYLLQAAAIPLPFYVPAINIEASHIITLVMLMMFGLGVLKVNK